MKTLNLKITFAVGLAWVFSSCGDSNLPDYNQLGDLRVLSVEVNNGGKSEAAPGDSVALTPLLSWVNGGGQTVSWTTEACRDPGIAFGQIPTCDSAPDKVAIGGAGTGSSAIGTSANAWTDVLPAISVTVPANIFNPGLPLLPISTADQQSGYAYLVFMTFTGADGQEVKTFKRIVTTTRTGAALNSNPLLNDLLLNGVALPASTPLPAEKVTLSAQFTGLESDDEATITWFLSDGELQRMRTTADLTTSDWTPPKTAPVGRSAIIVGVLRDGRGGESSKMVRFP